MRAYVSEKVEELARQFERCDWENKEFYREYVAQTYHYTRHSVRMLAAAAAAADENHTDYYQRSLQHIREEAGHEKLALADLKALGGDIADYPELDITRALWETQFYKIQRQPTALLGYILVLEALAVRCLPPMKTRLSKAYGANAIHFVRVHADEDPDHVEKAYAQIDALPEGERAAVWKNFSQTCAVWAHFMDDISAKAVKRSANDGTRSQETRRAA